MTNNFCAKCTMITPSIYQVVRAFTKEGAKEHAKILAEKVFTLELGERITVEGDYHIIRVPGGWIWDNVFVPFNTEFIGDYDAE